ncbi:hypothetical protein CYMTET_41490 [Cymbomonas tetramitiformis]|uniref:Uncharacterized protein n=1 Tax=Cymbomonas tetramitiformis TaxID=36881 RepID=A0AAE0C861_9CHLO|nr:hypothetical protein CYMTET_41490 [Cymbomonas tetramitiformis]
MTLRPQESPGGALDPAADSPDDVPPPVEPYPGVDEPSTDDDEPAHPTLAMRACDEDEEEYPAFADGPRWTPPAAFLAKHNLGGIVEP